MTPFGKLLRQERKERGVILADMAKDLGVSSPYLSQLETGQRPLSEAFVEKVIRVLDFSQADADALRRAAWKSLAQTVNTITIDLRDNATKRDRELASHLAMSFNRLKPETKMRLQAMLEDATSG